MSDMIFLDAVALRDGGAPDAFVATTQPVPWPKAYGGDLLAQAAAAAARTVGDDRALNAMHSLFVAPASIGADVTYDVVRLRDGRSYSTRAVTGREGEKIVFSGIASFHTGEDGPAIAFDAPSAPAPETVPSPAEVLAGVETAAARYWIGGRSFELRHVGDAPYLAPSPGRDHRMQVWIRAERPLGDDQALQRTALTYVCDYSMLEPALRAHGLSWSAPGVVTASTDHSIWIHDDVSLDEWVLCTLETVAASQGRATVRGEFHAEDGRHLASVMQQGVIRVRAAS